MHYLIWKKPEDLRKIIHTSYLILTDPNKFETSQIPNEFQKTESGQPLMTI